ncbi:hypothetical protein C8T65DRAFT_744991 [Cerioporus squamosus]|nr:hypothetical protein C8T65DRAFT_744991 [Cerioporus squamosus]
MLDHIMNGLSGTGLRWTRQVLHRCTLHQVPPVRSILRHASIRAGTKLATGHTHFLLSLTPLAINFYGPGIFGYPGPSFVGCFEDFGYAPIELMFMYDFASIQRLRALTLYTVPYVSRGGLIIADFLLIVVTWRTLGRGSVRPCFPRRAAGSLTDIMLWNGMIYFVLLTLLNVLHLAFTVAEVASDAFTSYISIFTDPLTALLVSRFLLDLQEATQQDMKLDTDHPLHFSPDWNGSLSFARVMGSIGAIIMPGEVPDNDQSSGAQSSESGREEGSSRRVDELDNSVIEDRMMVFERPPESR